MAATTTDLATNNPMRLLPIVAVLIAIVLLLVILAVIFVIIIRGRNGCANTASPVANASYQKPHSSHSLRQPLTAATTETATSIDDYHQPYQYRQPQKPSELNSPDLILPATQAAVAQAPMSASASKTGLYFIFKHLI